MGANVIKMNNQGFLETSDDIPVTSIRKSTYENLSIMHNPLGESGRHVLPALYLSIRDNERCTRLPNVLQSSALCARTRAVLLKDKSHPKIAFWQMYHRKVSTAYLAREMHTMSKACMSDRSTIFAARSATHHVQDEPNIDAIHDW